MSAWDFPLHADGRGRTAGTDAADHLRDLIEQVLFTAPGERVMRPAFGSGLLGLTFEPASAELAAAVQFLAQSALTQELGDLIVVDDVQVSAGEPAGAGGGAAVEVTVRWTERLTGEAGTATLRTPGGVA